MRAQGTEPSEYEIRAICPNPDCQEKSFVVTSQSNKDAATQKFFRLKEKPASKLGRALRHSVGLEPIEDLIECTGCNCLFARTDLFFFIQTVFPSM